MPPPFPTRRPSELAARRDRRLAGRPARPRHHPPLRPWSACPELGDDRGALGVECGAVKAISLWQPLASAIALGHTSIETRHWPTKYRGELAIHAATRFGPDEPEFASIERALGRMPARLSLGDRQSVGSGKSVSVRLEL